MVLRGQKLVEQLALCVQRRYTFNIGPCICCVSPLYVLPQIQLLMQFQMESDTNCMFSSQHFLRGWYLTVRYALGMSRQGVNVHSHWPSPWKFPCFFKKWWAIIQKSIYSLVSHNCWKHCNKLQFVLSSFQIKSWNLQMKIPLIWFESHQTFYFWLIQTYQVSQNLI